jgi:hypothetical protein
MGISFGKIANWNRNFFIWVQIGRVGVSWYCTDFYQNSTRITILFDKNSCLRLHIKNSIFAKKNTRIVSPYS